jgi:hypothetical protein
VLGTAVSGMVAMSQPFRAIRPSQLSSDLIVSGWLDPCLPDEEVKDSGPSNPAALWRSETSTHSPVWIQE